MVPPVGVSLKIEPLSHCVCCTIMAAFDIDMRTSSGLSCRISFFLLYFGSHLSSWTLVLVAIERLISVAWPLRAFEYCSRRRLVMAWIVLVFCLSFMNMHIFWTGNVIQLEPQHYPACAFEAKYFHFAYTIFPLVDMCIMASTFIVLFICNILIIIILTKAKRRRSSDMHSSGNQGQHDHVKGITTMLLTVCVFYMLTTTPLNIYLLHANVAPGVDKLISTILSLLYCTNNSVNFCLYVLSGSRFRQTLIDMCISRN